MHSIRPKWDENGCHTSSKKKYREASRVHSCTVKCLHATCYRVTIHHETVLDDKHLLRLQMYAYSMQSAILKRK